MRAIILKPDKKYFESTVFAIEYEYDNSYGFVRNCWFYVMNENKKIVRINEYVINTVYLNRQVFIRNIEPANQLSWIKENTFEGYSNFIKNEEIINKIKNGDSLDLDTQSKLAELNENDLNYYKNNYNRNEIINDYDAEDWLEFTLWFHDAHFEKICKDNDNLTIELSTVWGFKTFRLIFSGNISSFFEDDLDGFWFNGASLFFEKDGQICFADEEDYSTKEQIIKDKISYVFADSLKIEYEFDFDSIK